MTLTLRRGTPADAGECGRICYEAFRTIADRHGFPPDVPSVGVAEGFVGSLLVRGDVYSVVAERDGRIVGSNFLWESAPVSGVGPITVDPTVQDAAVGRRLMQDVLSRARETRAPGVRLVQAAYHCRSLSLYAKLGFVVREPLANLQGPALGLSIPGRQVRAALGRDLEACNRLCRAVHGHEREGELRAAVVQGTASVVEHDGRISGYTTGLGFFGYSVGETNDDLQALIGAATEFAGPGLLVPMPNAPLFAWCLAHGLRVVQPLTLMSLGLYNEPAGAFLPSILY